MVEQAPYSYIEKYYDSVHKKNAAFPEVSKFWLGGLHHVRGKRVLNLGCGPMFYDNVLHFGSLPETYVGVDLNQNSFAFLEMDTHPKLVAARTFAQENIPNMEWVAESAFTYLENSKNAFDTILGVGFFGTFDLPELKELLQLCHGALSEDGRLLKITWHGSLRTDDELAEKLRYRYDNELEPEAEEIIDVFAMQKFKVIQNEVFSCPPDTVGWRQIQVACFQRTQ